MRVSKKSLSSAPSDDKIVFTRKTSRHPQCVKVDWSESDTGVVWTSVFYWLGSADVWDSIISKIASNCIPAGSNVYTRLVPAVPRESRKMREDSLISSVRSTGKWGESVQARIRDIFSGGYLVQLSREQVPMVYQKYSAWMYGHQAFIVSIDPLPDWKHELSLGRFWGWRITKQLLERTYMVLFNHYEHGFELIGRSINPDSVRTVAEEVSLHYGLPLRIQENGNPFGDP